MPGEERDPDEIPGMFGVGTPTKIHSTATSVHGNRRSQGTPFKGMQCPSRNTSRQLREPESEASDRDS